MRTLLCRLLEVADEEKKEIFLVGGFVRDCLLKKDCTDVDVAVSGECEQFAKRVAWRLGGDYEPLDSKAGYHRVTARDGAGKVFYLDFSGLRARMIHHDLAGRDFTINAMAVRLKDYLSGPGWEERIIDPLGGKADLQNRVLKAVSEKSFLDDPVRLVRPFKFLLKLDLVLDEKTAGFIKKHGHRLKEAARFRVATELFSLLETPGAARGLGMLHELGLLYHLAEPALKRLRLGEDSRPVLHGLETCRKLEYLLSDEGPLSSTRLERLRRHLAQPLEAKRARLCYLLLACLFHDIGKAEARAPARARWFSHEQAADAFVSRLSARLRLTGKEYLFLSRLICNHSRPRYLQAGKKGEAGWNRFFFQFRDMAPELILLAQANLAANNRQGEGEKLFAALDEFFSGFPSTLPRPLVTAAELIETFNVPPNRRLGAVLEKVYTAQLKGRVKNKKEALALASVLLNEHY